MDALVAEGAGAQASPSASRAALSPLFNDSNRPAAVTTPCSPAGHVAEGQCDILTPIGQQPAAASQKASEGHASQTHRLHGPDAAHSGAGCTTPGSGVLPCETGGDRVPPDAPCTTTVRMGPASASPSESGWAVCSSQELDRHSWRTMASPAHGQHHREPLVAVPDAPTACDRAFAIAEDPAGPQGPAYNDTQLQRGHGESVPQHCRAEQPPGQPTQADSGASVDELPATAVAPQTGLRSSRHAERPVSQAEAAAPAAVEAQSAGPTGELLARVTAALCSGHQAAPPLPDSLVERLAAFPDCLLDAVKSGELFLPTLTCYALADDQCWLYRVERQHAALPSSYRKS